MPIKVAIQVLKEEGMKPVRGVVSFTNSVSKDNSSIVLVFATVFLVDRDQMQLKQRMQEHNLWEGKN